MTIDDKIRNEKLQYDIDRKAARIPALSSKKIDKYEYLTGQEILPFNQRQIIEPATFTYSVLGKAFKRQTKTIEDQGENQIKQLKIMENNWLNLMNLLKRILISTEMIYHSKNKKNLMNLLKKNLMNFRIQKIKSILIYITYI